MVSEDSRRLRLPLLEVSTKAEAPQCPPSRLSKRLWHWPRFVEPFLLIVRTDRVVTVEGPSRSWNGVDEYRRILGVSST
jgi:hypothetical protein